MGAARYSDSKSHAVRFCNEIFAVKQTLHTHLLVLNVLSLLTRVRIKSCFVFVHLREFLLLFFLFLPGFVAAARKEKARKSKRQDGIFRVSQRQQTGALPLPVEVM